MLPPPSTSSNAPHPQVTVFGAAVFIGLFAVDELLTQGWRVRAFVRSAEEDPFSSRPGVEVVRGDVRDGLAVNRAFTGSAAAVNLAGAKSDEPDSDRARRRAVCGIFCRLRPDGILEAVHPSNPAVEKRRRAHEAVHRSAKRNKKLPLARKLRSARERVACGNLCGYSEIE